MPTIGSPPAANTPQSYQKVSGGPRPGTAGGSASRASKLQQNGGSTGQKHTKVKENQPEDFGRRPSRPTIEDSGRRPSRPTIEDSGRRPSKPALHSRDGPREKPPSKDGTVQRTAKEVEGLKDFVRVPTPQYARCEHGYARFGFGAVSQQLFARLLCSSESGGTLN